MLVTLVSIGCLRPSALLKKIRCIAMLFLAISYSAVNVFGFYEAFGNRIEETAVFTIASEVCALY